MLSNRMALLGGPETGKTTLTAALVAKYSALADPPFPEDQKIAKLKELKREQCVSFLFRGPMGVIDLKDEPLKDESEKWNTDIAAAAKGLRQEPIRYPQKTETPHRLWADLEFMSHHIETRAKTGSYLRRLSMIDVPGRALDPESPSFEGRLSRPTLLADDGYDLHNTRRISGDKKAYHYMSTWPSDGLPHQGSEFGLTAVNGLGKA